MSGAETAVNDKVCRDVSAKPKVLLLGKLPPPYMGPAVATRILLDSRLKEMYQLIHVDTGANESLSTIGKWSLRKVAATSGIYRRMIRALWRLKPDLAIVPISQSTTGFLKDSVFIMLSRLSGTRTLVHLRGSDILNWMERSSPLTRAYVSKVLRWADGAIVLGENLRYLFRTFYPDSRIFVVPNGADYSFPRKNNTDTGPVRVLCISNLKSSKGIVDVLEAVTSLQAQGVRDYVVDIVGAWRSEAFELECKEVVRERRLPVIFHPATFGDEKLRLLSEADLFVFTPRAPEGHPWVIVEALAAGLPIISTDQGAITESVVDGVNGYVVATENPTEIAERMRQMIEDRRLREALGSASRAHYENGFTEEKMVGSLVSVIETVAGGDQRRDGMMSLPNDRSLVGSR